MAWKREPLPIEARPMYDSLGREVFQASPEPGAFLYHWADLDMAREWFRYARRLAWDQAAFARVDRAGSYEQSVYMYQILSAIMKGYNGLNIAWYNDPEARRLYRNTFAGPPKEIGGSTLAAEYGKLTNYNGTWFRANEEWPNIGSRADSPSLGQIPRRGRQLFERYYPSPNEVDRHDSQFVWRLWPKVRIADPEAESMLRGVPEEQRLDAATTWANDVDSRAIGRFGRCVRTDTGQAVECTDAPDWREFSFDVAGPLHGNGPLKMAPPLIDYLNWLRNWTLLVSNRTMPQIILDSRAYVIYQNSQSVLAFGGVNAFLEAAAATNATVAQQLSAPSSIATGVSLGIGAIGAALAPATFGVSALIAGAAAATIQVLNAAGFFNAGVSGRGRDDLGRYKPVFARAWLGGNVTSDDPNNAPQIPVDYPPGTLTTTTTNPNVNLGALTGLSGAPQGSVEPYHRVPDLAPPPREPPMRPAPEDEGSGSVPWVPLLIGGGLAYAAYRLISANRARTTR